MNTKAIRQLADVTLDKYRSSIPPQSLRGVREGHHRRREPRDRLQI